MRADKSSQYIIYLAIIILLIIFAILRGIIYERNQKAPLPIAADKVAYTLSTALKLSGQSGRPIYAFFSASWCPACRRQLKVLEEPEVKKKIEETFIFLYVDVDKSSQLAREFNITAIPTTILLQSQKNAYKILKKKTGIISKEELLKFISINTTKRDTDKQIE